MRTRLASAAALLAAGVMIGWLVSIADFGIDASAQEKAADRSVSRHEALANLPFEQGYPSKEATRTLQEELLFDGPCRATCGRSLRSTCMA